MTAAATETKTQRVERLKRAKNAWECLDEVRAFARDGYGSIPPEWLATYFRSWGVYTQGDGAGAIGGSGGEGRAAPYFMVRIRIPNGILSAAQARAIAALAQLHARGTVDITVRQNIQLHWITIEALPELLEQLWRAGLTTKGACGDDARNITGCPLAGVDADEICDASPLAAELTRTLTAAEFYNLPRKFKVSITGCRAWCSYPEINDVGLTAVVRRNDGRVEAGFSLRVGGGLSASPHLAKRLDAFVAWNQVAPVVQGIAAIFRDADVLRESREQARLKFLFLKHGWTAGRFLAELQERIGFALAPAVEEEAPSDVYRDHVGIHPQKQAGLFYVGASVLRGRMSAAQLRAAAEISDRFGDGQLRTTPMQNLLITNIQRERAAQAGLELETAGLPVQASAFRRGAIACTGTEFCKLAITETKSFARWLAEEMETRMPGFEQQLKLHVTGCPNSCGQHWIADIGLEGKKIKENGALVDAYYFCVGGGVGRDQAIARPVGYRCRAADVPDAMERLLRSYGELRFPGENLRQFFARHDAGQIRAFLAGAAIPAFTRDVAQAPPPHGVEG